MPELFLGGKMDNRPPVVKDENFFYCLECQQKSYLFECCNNSYCIGSGCDKCDELWDMVDRYFKDNADPNSPEFESRNNEY